MPDYRIACKCFKLLCLVLPDPPLTKWPCFLWLHSFFAKRIRLKDIDAHVQLVQNVIILPCAI